MQDNPLSSIRTAVLRDVRFAIRSLGRSPGFVLIAVATLGLGIGANTSMFSVLDGYIGRPAPYPDHDRLDRIYRSTPQEKQGGVSPADYLDLSAEMSRYGEIAAYGGTEMSLSEPGKPAELVPGLRISANLFSALGAEPRLGRSFRPDEALFGRHRVLIISHRCWQNRFGGDSRIVGRSVRVDGEPYEIVGVLSETFSDWRHLRWVDLYRPLGLDEKEASDRSSTWLRLIGRRSSALAPAQAGGFIASFGRRLARDFPAVHGASAWLAVPIDDTFLPGYGRDIMAMLVGLSGFVLLIACSNLANLLLARTMARARELAVRSALGASRAQMLRPLIVECLLLALGGGVCAVFVASWSFDWIAVHSAGDTGGGMILELDWHVLGWAFGACLFTVLAFGIVPALFALRLDPNSTLKSASRGTTPGHVHRRLHGILIVGQFALAMVLLAGAALFVRGLHELNSRRYGWESDHLVTGTVLLPPARYPGVREITEFQHLALERLQALPGVGSASVSTSMPFFEGAELRKYVIAGRQAPEPGHEPAATVNGITPRYFETVGTRLLAGRTFDDGDSAASPRVFVVNETMARALFGDESALGRRIAQAGGETLEWGEIVGIAGDVQSVSPNPGPVTYQVYQPMAQEARRLVQIAVRTAGVPPASVVGGIRTAMAALDPDLPVRKLQPAEATIARANYQLGVLRSILSALALLGLGLATLGVYGVVARTMAQRTGEFGIRVALGAREADITRLVLGSGAKLAFVGSALGLVGAFGVTRLIAAAFPGVRTGSLAVVIGATALLVGIALVACYVPARNASRISPNEMLRAE